MQSIRRHWKAALLAFAAVLVLLWGGLLASREMDQFLPVRRIFLAAIAVPLAMLCGVCTAAVFHRRDRRAHTEADVEAVTGMPPLAAVPMLGEAFGDAAEERLMQLASAIERDRTAGGKRFVVFTPASPSTAISASVHAVCLRLTGMGLTCQTVSAADMTSGDARGAMFDRLRAQYDVVLLEAAPLLDSESAQKAVRDADATILVVESAVTTETELRASSLMLEHAGARGVGVALIHLSRKSARRGGGLSATEPRGRATRSGLTLTDDPARLEARLYDMMQRRVARNLPEKISDEARNLDIVGRGHSGTQQAPSRDELSAQAAGSLGKAGGHHARSMQIDAEATWEPAMADAAPTALHQEGVLEDRSESLRRSLAEVEFRENNVADDLPDTDPMLRHSFFRLLERRPQIQMEAAADSEIDRAFARALRRPETESTADLPLAKPLVDAGTEVFSMERGAVLASCDSVRDGSLIEQTPFEQPTGGSEMGVSSITASVAVSEAYPASHGPDPEGTVFAISEPHEPNWSKPVVTAVASEAAPVKAVTLAVPEVQQVFAAGSDLPGADDGEARDEQPAMQASAPDWLASAEAERIRRLLARFAEGSDTAPAAEAAMPFADIASAPAQEWSSSTAAPADPLPMITTGLEVQAPAGDVPMHAPSGTSSAESTASSTGPWQAQWPEGTSFVSVGESPGESVEAAAVQWPVWPDLAHPLDGESPIAAAGEGSSGFATRRRPWFEAFEDHFRPVPITPEQPAASEVSLSAEPLAAFTSRVDSRPEEEPLLTAAETVPLATAYETETPSTPTAAAPVERDSSGTFVPAAITSAPEVELPTPMPRPAAEDSTQPLIEPVHIAASHAVLPTNPISVAYTAPNVSRASAEAVLARTLPQSPGKFAPASVSSRDSGRAIFFRELPRTAASISPVGQREPIAAQNAGTADSSILHFDEKPANGGECAEAPAPSSGAVPPSAEAPTPWKTRKPPMSASSARDLTPQPGRWEMLSRFDPESAVPDLLGIARARRAREATSRESAAG
jgi:hypothetical protein